MAGRERSGAIAAQADLFEGRSWVVAPGPAAGEVAVATVLDLAVAVGAAPIRMTPADHDAAVAAVSHVPQIAASLVAARLRELPDSAVALAGQGIRDVTRIAASDPMMWTQILAGNAPALRTVLEELAVDLDAVLHAVRALDAGAHEGGDGQGARGVLARAVASGNAGHARIPGKHGSAPTAYATVTVLVPDEPGALGRLFHDIGEAGINLEDLHLEHGIGAPVGLAELAVLPAAAEPLSSALLQRGWRVHD
jgi:prephenate dehydrogenase